jgi:hypothetical protein
MSTPKDPSGFFRKVVKFVANPATDWTELGEQNSQSRESEFAKSELRAMIERKRRNDFVRKRELDMLRRVRREGLNPDQLAALATSSRLDDSEARLQENHSRPDVGVKAKIDEIEKQMVAENFGEPPRRSRDKFAASDLPSDLPRRGPTRQFPPTRPDSQPAAQTNSSRAPTAAAREPAPPTQADLDKPLDFTMSFQSEQNSPGQGATAVPPGRAGAPANVPTLNQPIGFKQPGGSPTGASTPSGGLAAPGIGAASRAPASASPSPTASGSSSATSSAGMPAMTPPAPAPSAAPVFKPLSFDGNTNFSNPFALEVNEVMHDPELDEAVIAFANADFETCEQSLAQATSAKGSRFDHAETWLVLFDMYRAIGEQAKFESLAVEYAHQFGWSAPQWFSMPQMVAQARTEERPRTPSAQMAVGWSAAEVVDADAVSRLRAATLQLPMPWVFDWSALRSIDIEASIQLTELLGVWSRQELRMRWLEGDRLLNVLADLAPTGAKDADPAYWALRLEVLRLTNRPDQFDEVAIDYCVTYEVSPPSWEPAKCVVRLGDAGRGESMQGSLLSEVSTGFAESRLMEDAMGITQTTVELSGQLVGDIGALLEKLTSDLGPASTVNVSCDRLIRVDFIAAGDIFNWVLARRAENRSVAFMDVHRLLGLFFSAMGINEHAQVKVRAN